MAAAERDSSAVASLRPDRARCLTGREPVREYGSGRAAVLVDQPAENIDPFDACARIGDRFD